MIRGIDIHVHVFTGDRAKETQTQRQFQKDAATYFKTSHMHALPDEMAEMYQRLDMMAVIFDVDRETLTGLKISNDEVAGWMQKYPKTFIGFGSVDPWKGARAVDEVHRCASLGLRGMKFQQAVQAFNPADPRFYPIYQACVRHNLPVLFHTGTTGIGAGTPGGRGHKLEYCRPIPYIDNVAADFPELRIIMAHPAWPWHEEQLAVAVHKANAYIDLSGWAPKYFPPAVVQYANTLLKDKMFFGSDFPMIAPDRWLKEFAELPIKDEVRPKILYENAARFLGIELGD